MVSTKFLDNEQNNSNIKTSIQEQWLRSLEKQLKEKNLKPLYVQWFCTHQCNFKCIHCGTDAAEKNKNELKTKEIISTIKDLSELKCEFFIATGGEPLLRRDLFIALGYAKNLGLKTGLVTNGFLVEKYKKEIAKLELDSVMVSIDGYRKKHDIIRGVDGAYEHAINALDVFTDINIPVIGVSTVILNDNLTDIPSINDDVIKHGCMVHRLQAVINEGRAKNFRYKPNVLENVFKFILDKRKQGIPVECDEGFGYLGPLEEKLREYRFFCQAGYRTFVILENGDIIGCSALDHPELCEGNIRTESIKDIWWNKFQQFRDRDIWYKLLPQKCKECSYLMECRGGCWVHRVNGEYCYLPIAKNVAEKYL